MVLIEFRLERMRESALTHKAVDDNRADVPLIIS